MITYSPADEGHNPVRSAARKAVYNGVRIALHLVPADEGVAVRLLAGDDPTAITAEAHTVLQHIDEVQRMASQAAFHDDVGRGLFRSLLPGVLGDQFRTVYTQATVSGARLTLELHLDPALMRLARYPWELLHDGTRFLLQTGAVDLVRMIPYPAPYPDVTPAGDPDPLRILIATPNPAEYPPLAGSFDALETAFAAQQRADTIDIAPLFPPTWESLMDWLLAGGPDVLQVESHADFTRTGRLLWEDARGKVDPVASDLLVSALGSTDLPLLLLNAGVTGHAGEDSMLSSAAATLVLLGLPAVIAAQHTLPQAAAVAFAQAVYAALLAGEDVESAVLAGRRALSRTGYWYVPTLTRRNVVPAEAAGMRLSRQVYTAAAGSVQTGWTTRPALWLAPTRALPPSSADVLRMVGVEHTPQKPDLDPQPRLAADLPDAYPPGTLDIRLSAPGCEVHTPTRTLTLCTDRDTPPVWFALTPRQPGPVTLTFEIWRGSHRLCTLTHPLHAVTDPPDHAAAQPVLYSHGEAAHTRDITATGEHPVTPVPPAQSAHTAADPDAAGEGHESRSVAERSTSVPRPPVRNPIPGAPPEPEQQATFDDRPRAEALDGVLDTLQTGLPPETADDPLEDPSVRKRRAAKAAHDAEAMIDTVLVAMQVTPANAPDAPYAPQDEDTRLGDLPPAQRLRDIATPAMPDASPPDAAPAAVIAKPQQDGTRLPQGWQLWVLVAAILLVIAVVLIALVV